MHSRSLAMASWLAVAGLGGCTVTVPVGIDPIRPRWAEDPIDADEDGVVWARDCDDTNPWVGEPVPESCDGEDNDCNGRVDDAGACEREDRFVQQGTVDVLLIVDPRAPAAEVRQKLQNALPDLLGPLHTSGRTLHLGVLSMDAGDPAHMGRLVPLDDGELYLWSDRHAPGTGPALLGGAIEALANTPEDPFQGPLGGRWVTEQMLRVLQDFNGGFRRSESFLALLYASPTEDVTDPDVEELARVLDELHGAGRWSASAIFQVGDENCADKLAEEDAGDSYAQLVELGAGGLPVHHCVAEYGTFAANLGEQLASRGLRQVFELSAPPIPSTVVVTIVRPGSSEQLPPTAFQIVGMQLLLAVPPPPDAEVVVVYDEDPGPEP